MTRLVALIALASVVATGIGSSVTARGGSSLLATPTSAQPEIAGSVPVSLMIRNDGTVDDRLTGGKTPAAARVDLHNTQLVDGNRVMEVAVDGIAIPAGETLVLEPGRSHLMLVGPRAGLVQGATFQLTLLLAREGNVPVTVRVRRKIDAAGVPALPPVAAGDLTILLASAPPAPAGNPVASPHP